MHLGAEHVFRQAGFENLPSAEKMLSESSVERIIRGRETAVFPKVAAAAHGGLAVRDDPIVEETRAARRELHEELGGDQAALFLYLKKIEAANADRLVRPEPKPAVQTNRKG